MSDDWIDISDDVELADGKSNSFGWSTYNLKHGGEKFGSLYCGDPKITHPDYRAEIVDGGVQKRLIIYCKRDTAETVNLAAQWNGLMGDVHN